MVKRVKRLEKAIESLKKEIDKSLIYALENKIGLIGESIENIELIKKYKKLLEEYKKKLGII